MFFAMCEDHQKSDIDLALSAIENIVNKLNMTDFDIIKETSNQLVSPVFRSQK